MALHLPENTRQEGQSSDKSSYIRGNSSMAVQNMKKMENEKGLK